MCGTDEIYDAFIHDGLLMRARHQRARPDETRQFTDPRETLRTLLHLVILVLASTLPLPSSDCAVLCLCGARVAVNKTQARHA